MKSSTGRRVAAVAATASLALLTAACGGGGFDNGSSSSAAPTAEKGPVALKMLIASSGDAETAAVKAATAAWAKSSGNTVDVQVAQDIKQQLGQAFAGGTPPDIFYTDAARFPDYAKAGALFAYGDQVKDPEDFYAPLKATFTYEDKFYCAPKDFSTIALEINSKAWKAAGLTDGDIPTTWDELHAVAKKLTNGKQTGLAIGDTRDRIDAFMVQNGGGIISQDGKTVTASSPQNVQALAFVKTMLADGSAKYPKQLDSGWAGEAFGKGKAAMTMEGNWIKGSQKNDYPDVDYQVAELPQGPKGKGTLLFTQCWGIAAKSTHHAAAIDLVNSLTSVESQLAAADAFGVMPSRQSARAQYEQKFPEDKAFIAGGEYGQGPVNKPGFDSVLADFDTGLQGLATGDPKTILDSLQKNAEAALQQ
jgi:multiple sugar transport system substrate-binding protein